ncbi:mitochondrial phosphate carrier protein [Mortierella sp. AD011]|nr:mitochondrial phosphate carrier protein [Mortierella sp. AD010]KAF9401006.1 mitochondrial phosphate carrier protein [Mortierella sp. AD011]
MSTTIRRDSTAPPLTGIALYSRFYLAGAICCSVTHGSLTPVDVIKTRIQLEPTIYNKGMVGTFRQIVKAEGSGALWTGFGPTFLGYFLQGGFKFGGYEFWKKTLIDFVGRENAIQNRTAIYLVGAGIAEFFADVALCPLEATRIRLVSQPTFARGLTTGFSRILREEGFIHGFYSGFGPIIFKQIPYTMAKFVAFEHSTEVILGHLGDPAKLSPSAMTGVNLTAGLCAGVAAALVSQPADTLLSKINKTSGTGSASSRLLGLARELGPRGLFLGMGARLIQVAALTSLQFGIYGGLKQAFGATNGVEIHKIKNPQTYT